MKDSERSMQQSHNRTIVVNNTDVDLDDIDMRRLACEQDKDREELERL